MNELLKLYLKENFEKEKTSCFGKLLRCTFEDYETMEAPLYQKDNDLPSYIKENQNTTFQNLLFKLIDDRNLKDSDVYNKVNLDRRLFSKIRSDNTYHPSKETVLLLGISLELSEEEMDMLLESASYTLAKNNYFDLILRFCFINHIYNVIDINTYLDEYHCKLLNN